MSNKFDDKILAEYGLDDSALDGINGGASTGERHIETYFTQEGDTIASIATFFKMAPFRVYRDNAKVLPTYKTNVPLPAGIELHLDTYVYA